MTHGLLALWRRRFTGSWFRRDGVWVHTICGGKWLAHQRQGMPAATETFSSLLAAIKYADKEWPYAQPGA